MLSVGMRFCNVRDCGQFRAQGDPRGVFCLMPQTFCDFRPIPESDIKSNWHFS